MALPSPLRQRKLTWIVEIGEYPPYRTGPYEEHLNYSKNEREDVQKKTFAKWINSQLAKNGKPPVDDLFQDLRDGEVLLSLLEILTGQQFKRERGHMRVHHLNNVNAALRLVWSIILHWQVHYHLKELMSELQQTNLEKTLLSWCRNHTESYAGVNVTNFTTSWSDGLAFNALLHRWRPHLFDFDTLVAESETRRLEHAFSLAHTHLGIDRLLDPEDVNTPNPDKKSIMMYVMCLFQSLPTPDTQPLTEAALAANNEKFLLDLSEQQWRVGAVLEEGARLIRDAALTKDEANEVRLQMRLLNSRWEELRVRAMERQSELHAKLMKAQHTHLDNFREWLTKTEDRMSRMETAQQSAGEALEAAQQLHAELRTQQPLVDALADCVVVVDDEMEHDTSVTEIEDQLRALGERWSHACQWIVQRLQRLQGLQALHERGAQLKSDADALETELKQMETYPVSEIGEVLERISQLQRCKHSISVQRSAIAEHLQRLPALEEASFSEAAEELNDRLDALEMILMVQVDRIKELGFEVDMNSDAQTDTSTVTTTLTLHASKKPRLSAPDFQCMNKLESSGRSEELIEVIQRVQKESSSQATDFAHVEEIQRRLGAQRELAEEAKMHAENIDKLKRRWEGIQKSLLDIRNMMNLLEDKENFYKNLEVIQNEINEKHAWKDKMLTDRPTNNQLIHLRNKIRSMRQYEVRLKELNAQSIILLTKALPKSHKDEIEADTKRINDAFEELFTHLSKREVEIKLALNKKPLEHHEDEYSNVKRRIEEMQSGLISEHAMLSTSDVVEKKLAELYKMKRDFDGLQTSYDNAIRDRKQNYERGSVEELNMRSSVENLVTRFHDSRAILAQKISKLEKGKELLESFESNMREVNQYVERVEEFVKTHTALPHGDVTELEKLVIESNNLDEEKKKYKTEIETIVRIRDEILEDCDDALAKTIKNDVKDLQKRFEITNESFKLNESLRRSLEKSENVFRRIAEIEKWLEVIENEIPKEDECAIRDSGELYQMKTRFQTLKDKCDEKTTEFRSLNEAGNDILLAAEQGAGGVARRLTHLNALWTRVTHCIYERYNTERVERIEAIGRQLIEAHIMPQWIQAEIDNIAHRFNDLNEQAQGRIRELEAAAKEAARSEVYIDNIHQWILQLKTRERSRDLPDEKQLTSEWESQRAVLRTVEEQRKLDEVREQYLTKRDAGNEQQQDQSEQRIEIRLQRAHDSLLERFYRTLSEIKSEVESIIKSGRKMVEEKTVPEPQEFSKKIDSLKELYNKLGAHVTESKSRLETALLTAREIQNDLQSLMSWLQGLGNVGKQTLELEMSRMEAIKDKLNANYVEFSKICEPMYLGNLREQIDNINERWEHLKRHGLGKKETELEVLQRYLNDIDQELESPETMTVAKLKLLKTEVRAKASEVDAMDNKALTKQWERIVEKITAKESNNNAVVVEYESVTDTIKRRLESPVNSPDTEKPEFKKSKIPLALKSPMPIKKEIKEGGIRSRGSSLERRKKKGDSPMSDSVTSTMSVDSIEDSASLLGSLPSTPGTPRKDSSTFNLLKDSDLFTQISKNKIVPKTVNHEKEVLRKDSCQVVAVKEHEIMKSRVSPTEPMEIYPSDTVETLVEFIPQTVETVEIFDDTEDESADDSEGDESMYDDDCDSKRSSIDLGTEPKTFVVQVKTLDARMKPTLGILKHRNAPEEKKKKVTVVDIPDLIPTNDLSDNDVSMKTPPPTPLGDSEVLECPLLYDLAVRQKDAQKSLLRDEVNEYLILDEVPKDQASLPEPSATETLASDSIEAIRDEIPLKKSGVSISGSAIDRIRRRSSGSGTEDEVIYSEVDDKPQVRVSASDFDDKKPTATSTPIKDEKSKKQVQVVAMSPKPNQEVDDNRDEVVPKLKLTMSPLLSTKSYIPISKEKKLHNEKYQRTDDNSQVSENNEPPESPDASSTIRSRFGSACDTEVEQFEIAAQKMARRLHVMLLTLGGVASERDPAKRLEILKNQLGAIAPDAAALISRGDSLVYAKHKENPQMAEYLQTHFQDKLRNKWSMVMSEIESKRNAAIKAEDDVKELTGLIEKLQKWVKEYKSGDVVDGENDCERIQELVRELKAQRVAYPERAAADVCTAFNCVRDAYDAALPKKDKKGKDTEGNEAVTRINRAREAVASVMTALRSHPLNGRDYDDFPMQEDALSRIKSSMSEAGVAVEEAENSRRRASSERVKRVADKLRDEWSSLQTAWSSCQTNWAALYAALERDGESLDSLEGDIDTMDKQDVKLLNEFQEKLSEVERNVRDTVNAGAAVVRACGGALARDVLEQLDALRDRLAALTDRDAEELLRGQTKNADYIKNIRDELQQSPVKEKETEIREVIENYNNIERECVAAKQTVSPEVRERVLKLKEDWGFIRNACERETSRASPVKREEDRKSESPVTGNLRCIEFFIVVYLLYSRIFLH
ncbi:unnamed protein product [Leptidea sinapis]|uniref:Calponin-homology (CH) domain-containing protein n=1 Tax=Leptidea sinapis TaxID=189913 RepID=A0A5E4QAL9_9NEOP|nr:unnamed protein product [Leptidea sinapis]